MKHVYIPLLIVWTVLIVFQQATIFMYQKHVVKQRDLISSYQISLCECINVTESCVKLVTRKEGP